MIVFRVTREDAGAAANTVGDPTDDERAMALAIASIPPAERRRILDLMAYATARLEARLLPLAADLDDDDVDPVEQLHDAMRPYLPALTAARAFDEPASGGGLAVRVAASCEAAAVAVDETCVPLWDASDGPTELAGRARFLAWAAAHAAVVETESRAAALELASGLRARAMRDESPIALVFLDDDLALRPVAERDELKEAARRLGTAMAANEIHDAEKQLDALARPPPSGRVAPWLQPSPTTVVVVPRLSALARTSALVAEIETLAGRARLRWIHRPDERTARAR